jgi:hypothetical protein
MAPVPLAFGSIDLGGVVVCGLMFGALFGLPLAAVRAALGRRGERLARFGSTAAAGFVSAFLIMFLLWVVGP